MSRTLPRSRSSHRRPPSLRVPVAALGLAIVAATLGFPQPAEARRKEPRINEYAPTAPILPPAPPADGAIFHAAMGYAPLTSGARAAMVGATLPIVLVEKTAPARCPSSSRPTPRSAATAPSRAPAAPPSPTSSRARSP